MIVENLQNKSLATSIRARDNDAVLNTSRYSTEMTSSMKNQVLSTTCIRSSSMSNTCKPLPEQYWDVRSCNSTGMYSGVQDDSNGNRDGTSNLNKTALREIQKTKDNGVSHFRTLFSRLYSGGVTHVRVIGHLNATLFPNSTVTGTVFFTSVNFSSIRT